MVQTPLVASNRMGTERMSATNITFYGGSFIAGPTGEVRAQVQRTLWLAGQPVFAMCSSMICVAAHCSCPGSCGSAGQGAWVMMTSAWKCADWEEDRRGHDRPPS